MKLKSIAKELLVCFGISVAAAGANAATITTPDGTFDFGGFDWSSAGSVLVDGYNVTSGMVAGTTDTFTLYYQSSLATFLDSGGASYTPSGLRSGSNPGGYEFTIYASIQERVTCVTAGCSIVTIDVLSGTWNVNYQAVGNSSLSNGTGFIDGATILSGIFTSGDTILGAQGPTNPGNVTLSGTFRGDVNFTDSTFINPDLLNTEAVSTLQFGTNTTAWTRPANFEAAGYFPSPADSNTQFIGQADSNQSFGVPEPGTLALLGMSLVGLGFMRRKH